MRMTPKEQEKLLLHFAGNLAKERREKRSEIELSGGSRLYQLLNCLRWQEMEKKLQNL